MAIASYYVSWIINWPHFSASIYKFYNESKISENYVSSIFLPITLILLCVGIFMWPLAFSSSLVSFYLIWSAYHYCFQGAGITTLYLKKSNVKIGKVEILSLKILAYLVFLSSVFKFKMSPYVKNYYGIYFNSISVPEVVYNTTFTLMALVIVLLVFRISQKSNFLLTLYCFTPLLIVILWFQYAAKFVGLLEFVPALHSLQFLFLAFFYERKSSTELSRREEWRKIGKWGYLNLIGGALLFWGIPKYVSFLTNVEEYWVMGVIIVFVQLWHFWLDGMIWKESYGKNKTVSKYA